MFCSSCGTEFVEGSIYCAKCGAKVGKSDAATTPPREPIVINGVTFRPGSGEFESLYSAGTGGWVTIENGIVKKWRSGSQPSTGRKVGGVVCLLVAAVLALLGFSWFQGFVTLEADGNQFAGILALLGVGAWVVGAAFGVWGVTLFSRK